MKELHPMEAALRDAPAQPVTDTRSFSYLVDFLMGECDWYTSIKGAEIEEFKISAMMKDGEKRVYLIGLLDIALCDGYKPQDMFKCSDSVAATILDGYRAFWGAVEQLSVAREEQTITKLLNDQISKLGQ